MTLKKNDTDEPRPAKRKVVALRPSQVVNKKRVIYEFEDAFLASFGRPERIAKWFITGPSFSGKSSFVFQLCAYLCRFGKVDYNSFEEGDTETVSDKIKKHGLQDHENSFKLLPKVPVEDFKDRMLRKKSASFGVIDSVQHAAMNKRTYDDFVDTLCVPRKGKSMIFINHWVKDGLTLHIRHDCDVKIEVIGFVAWVESRYGGNKPFVIWEQGAKNYWGKKYKSVTEGKYWPGKKK